MKRAASDMVETAFAAILGDYPESLPGGSSGRGAGGHMVHRSRILAAFRLIAFLGWTITTVNR
jgi:hypothetical protein